MNIESLKPYITKTIESYAFYRHLDQTEEPIKTILEKQPTSYQEAEKILYENYSRNDYSLGWVSKQGDKITQIELFQRNCKGTLYQVIYKGLFFNFECTLDGEINRVHLVYNGFRSHSGWIELRSFETIETIYERSVKIVQEDKREIMNYYNKLIKDTKTDYRERLAKVNAILKEATK